VDLHHLLDQLGESERVLGRDLAGARGEEAPRGPCWPAWRIWLHQRNDAGDFQAWWEEHGQQCPTCREIVGRVRADEERAANADRGPQRVLHLCDESCLRRLPWAAAGSQPLLSATTELPLVEYHRLAETADPDLSATWCVTWDSAVFLVLVGPPAALERWRTGASVLDLDGHYLGGLVPADSEMARLLAPEGALNGGETACFQFQLSAVELHGTPVAIPNLLNQGFQLVPTGEAVSRAQELVADLASRNRLSRFLAELPEETEDREEAATLCFYLRVLNAQGRLGPPDRKRLLDHDWLAPDLRATLTAPGETEGPT
jgi:hypothetical protein